MRRRSGAERPQAPAGDSYDYLDPSCSEQYDGASKSVDGASKSVQFCGTALTTQSGTAVRCSTTERRQAEELMVHLRLFSEGYSDRVRPGIFLRELVGHWLQALLGPLALPIIWKIYGGRCGLANRCFWLQKRWQAPLVIVQYVCWLGTAVSVCLWILDPSVLMMIELRILLIALNMRISTIAIKYAFMPSTTWQKLNTEDVGFEFSRRQLISQGWGGNHSAEMRLQAELALAHIVGSTRDRQRLKLKFRAWPRTQREVLALREESDLSSKYIIDLPTGRILRPGSMFRKVERLASADRLSGQLPDIDPSKMPETLQETFIGSRPLACQEVVSCAGVGGSVPIDDLFNYAIDAVMTHEKAMFPNKLLSLSRLLVALAFVLFPSLWRVRAGGRFFGDSRASAVAIIGLWPISMIAIMSIMAFVLIGAKDMWRRRTLMRFCTALLSFQVKYRRSCLPEANMLPILDFTDAQTIEGWIKLRQLCLDWGFCFHLRVRSFTGLFFVIVCLMMVDLWAVMNIEPWRHFMRASFFDIFMFGIFGFWIGAFIVLLVQLGNEVNEAAERQIYLLSRHRFLIASSIARRAASARKASKAKKRVFAGRRRSPWVWRRLRQPAASQAAVARAAVEGADRERVLEFLDICSLDISAEQLVNPVQLLGMRCGWSLLSALYMIPLTMLSQVAVFCSSEAAQGFCSVRPMP